MKKLLTVFIILAVIQINHLKQDKPHLLVPEKDSDSDRGLEHIPICCQLDEEDKEFIRELLRKDAPNFNLAKDAVKRAYGQSEEEE